LNVSKIIFILSITHIVRLNGYVVLTGFAVDCISDNCWWPMCWRSNSAFSAYV